MSDIGSPPERSPTETPHHLSENQPQFVAANDDYILEILIENALVTKSQVQDARDDSSSGKSVLQVLMGRGLITQEDVSRAVASNAAMDFVVLDGDHRSGRCDVAFYRGGRAALPCGAGGAHGVGRCGGGGG